MVNTILVRLWDYIEDYLEELKKHRDEMTAAGQSISAEELLEAGLGSLIGTSTSATGCVSRPVTDEEDSEEISSEQTAGNRAKNHADAKEAEGDSESGEADGTGENESEDENDDASGKTSGESESDDDSVIPLPKMGNAGKQKTTEHEQGRIPLSQTSSVSNPVGGTVNRDEDYERECDERAAADIERMFDKMTGLLMGRRLDTHALCRNDGKVFYKNSLPNEIPEMVAVGLLLDESGSMSSCDRCTYARATAIILYDFCRGLDIPVMIYGHSTGYDSSQRDTVDLYSYAEFESID